MKKLMLCLTVCLALAALSTSCSSNANSSSSADEEYEKMRAEHSQLVEEMAPFEEELKKHVKDNLPEEYIAHADRGDVVVIFIDRDLFAVSLAIDVHGADMEQTKQIVADICSMIEESELKLDSMTLDVYSDDVFQYMYYHTPYTNKYGYINTGKGVNYTFE